MTHSEDRGRPITGDDTLRLCEDLRGGVFMCVCEAAMHPHVRRDAREDALVEVPLKDADIRQHRLAGTAAILANERDARVARDAQLGRIRALVCYDNGVL